MIEQEHGHLICSGGHSSLKSATRTLNAIQLDNESCPSALISWFSTDTYPSDVSNIYTEEIEINYE